jgi:predicted ATPase/DNA-binding CsgD family transcriptional regulator
MSCPHCSSEAVTKDGPPSSVASGPFVATAVGASLDARLQRSAWRTPRPVVPWRWDPMAHLATAMKGHHNLPTHATALVGRDREVANLRQLVLSDDGRLITLTGVGGCGKTRLALGVASSLIGSFKDGAWMVELASLADPLLVHQAVASVLGVREQSDRSLLDVLVAYLARRQVLLVLDNCEHLVKVCAELADTLLHGCPGVRLLATSREALHIPGERAWRVPSLAIPDPRSIVRPDELVRYSAAQLFVERAQAVQSNFGVTPRSAPVLVAICARLEGLPLAIELAAAWVRALGVEQILERLDDAFELLVGGSRLAPSRQQTMRATLDWSYGLLAPPEQIVFGRLAVFVGGWSLEAAEEVCSDGGVAPQDVLGLLTRLVDASLIHVDERDGRARYRLLEPVRQYAHERVVASGELDAVRLLHATYFQSLAEQLEIDANVGGPRRQAAHAALELERDNLRAALRWCLDQGEAQMGFRLGRAHWNLWVVQGAFSEGRAWLTQLIALPDGATAPAMRAVAQTIEATLAWRQGSYARARELQKEALPLLRQADDPWALHAALADVGWIALYLGDYRAAQAHFDESLAVARVAGDRVNEAIALSNLGWLALAQDEYSAACALSEASLAVARAVGDKWAVSLSHNIVATVALRQGDLATARRVAEESVVLVRQIGERAQLANSLDLVGQVATAEGHYAEARAALRESLLLHHDMGNRTCIADTLESIAALAATEAQSERAVQLAGAAAGIRVQVGAPLSPMRRDMLEHWLVPVRQALGAETTTLAWEAGRNMAVEPALDLALAATEAPATRSNWPLDRSAQQVARLSPREREVAALLAHGLSNRQIAERLVVTERTVAAHIEHILNKLGFGSRHQVGAWANENGLFG